MINTFFTIANAVGFGKPTPQYLPNNLFDNQNTTDNLTTLSQLKKGETGVVHHFTNDEMASKLLTMGILPGKMLQLVRRVPFGGGLYIKVECHTIAVREAEAQNIIVELTH